MNAQKYSQLAWPGALTLLTGMYIYWATHNNLVSSRPSIQGKHEVPDPIPSPGIYTLHSRIWDDPLSTAYENWKELPGTLRETTLRSVLDGVKLTEECKAANQNTPSDEFEEIESQCDVEGPAGNRRDMRTRYAGLISRAPTLCLAVLLPGEPYAEDKERRMRTRYAVETALAETDYYLTYSRRMSYVVPKVFVRSPGGWQEREIVIPVKLYRHKLYDPADENENPPQILVFWINETELGQRPLLASHRILNAIFCTVKKEYRQKLKVAMIGPTTSDMLQAMATEYEKHIDGTSCWKWHWNFATYDNNEVLPQHGFSPLGTPDVQTDDGEQVPIFSPRATVPIEEPFQKSRIKLYRAIETDDKLIKALHDELERRAALNGKVVLVAENDSSYGQRFREIFGDRFEKKSKPLVFGMMRGIDGMLPGDDGETNTLTQSPKSENVGQLASAPDTIGQRRPEGRSQYDYLRRLGQQIRDRTDGERISAIGVVCTDVYDKLLFLRALRPQFPDAVFFTTDMDAIYTDPNESAHTRGLIVASHFGLSLDGDLQARTPPFRDSYQTSTFLATRLAVYDGLRRFRDDNPCAGWTQAAISSSIVDPSGKLKKWFVDHEKAKEKDQSEQVSHVPVLSYVIGRKRPLQLESSNSNGMAGIHPDRATGAREGHLFVVAMVAFLTLGCGVGLAYCGARLRFHWLRFFASAITRGDFLTASIAWLVVVGLVLIGAVLIVGVLDPEMAAPLSAFSTWAGNLLYALAGTIAACVILCARFLLKRHFTKALGDVNETYSEVFRESVRRACGDCRPGIYFSTQMLPKCVIVSLTVVSASALFVFGYAAWPVWVGIGIGWFIFAVAANLADRIKWDNKKRTIWELNPFLSNKRIAPIAWGLVIVFAMVLIVLISRAFVAQAAPGWAPVSMSRGLPVRILDFCASAYAVLAVGLLYGMTLYIHLWCPAFIRDVNARGQDFFETASAKGLDRLRLAGRLTSVLVWLAPTTIALLLVLVLAYHPWVSSTPMPLGVLVVISLAMLSLVSVALWMRRHFQLERKHVLSDLDQEILDAQNTAYAIVRDPNAYSYTTYDIPPEAESRDWVDDAAPVPPR